VSRPPKHAPGAGDAPGGGVRLHKLLADAGVASRRAAEQLILDGLVKVNGRVVSTLPAWANPETDRVTVRGKPVEPGERKIYVMLNKPRHTVSTVTDPDGRRTVTEIVNHPSGARLYPVGRLDYDTTGLLLMTNDGGLANKLTHPRFGVHKTYRAIIKGRLSDEEAQQLQRGVHLALRRDGRTEGAERAAAVRLDVVKREPERTILDITLSEGRNRQVRRMLAHVGHRVKKLQRIEMGPLRLKGVRLGEWRELTIGEVRALRAACRPRPARARRRRPHHGSHPR
jgi:23S rRNA pseudouridine2605 synthase